MVYSASVDTMIQRGPINQLASLLNVMSEECSRNVVELVCHSFFKECKEVPVDDPQVDVATFMLPSLLCKSECERHKVNTDTKYNFKDNILTANASKSWHGKTKIIVFEGTVSCGLHICEVLLSKSELQDMCSSRSSVKVTLARIFFDLLAVKKSNEVEWDECVADIRKDPDAETLFNQNMRAVVEAYSAGVHQFFTGEQLPRGANGAVSPFAPLDCEASAGEPVPAEDAFISAIFGRRPQELFWKNGLIGWLFPRLMSSDKVFPEESSSYIGADGKSYEVPCTVPAEAQAFEKVQCPAPFVDSILPETAACVYSCPVHQFSVQQYNTMWAVFVAIGLGSFLLNVFMALTWKLAGRRRAGSYEGNIVKEHPEKFKGNVRLSAGPRATHEEVAKQRNRVKRTVPPHQYSRGGHHPPRY